MKIVFSDLDGTILSSDKTIAPKTFEVLDELAAQGIEFVPCTARSLTGVVPEFLVHPSVHYVIGSNGAAIYKLNKSNFALPAGTRLVGQDAKEAAASIPFEVIRQIDVDKESVVWLYEQVANRNIMFDISSNGKTYSERPRYERMDQYDLTEAELRSFKTFRTPVDVTIPELLDQLDHIERIIVYWKDRADRDAVTSLVDTRDDLFWANSLPINVEISNAAATKGTGLTWLCDYLDIPVSEAISFGDGMNDVPMLIAAGDGVAMANSMPEVLEHADHIAQDNDAPGVALYLEELLAQE